MNLIFLLISASIQSDSNLGLDIQSDTNSGLYIQSNSNLVLEENVQIINDLCPSVIDFPLNQNFKVEKIHEVASLIWDTITKSSKFLECFKEQDFKNQFRSVKRHLKNSYLYRILNVFGLNNEKDDTKEKFLTDSNNQFIENMINSTKQILETANTCGNHKIGINEIDKQKVTNLINFRTTFIKNSESNEFPLIKFESCDEVQIIRNMCEGLTNPVNHTFIYSDNPELENAYENRNSFTNILRTLHYQISTGDFLDSYVGYFTVIMAGLALIIFFGFICMILYRLIPKKMKNDVTVILDNNGVELQNFVQKE